MVEFSDLFDNEDDVFQKKAKVTQLRIPPTSSHPQFLSCPIGLPNTPCFPREVIWSRSKHAMFVVSNRLICELCFDTKGRCRALWTGMLSGGGGGTSF